jgi:hypothetical protein
MEKHPPVYENGEGLIHDEYGEQVEPEVHNAKSIPAIFVCALGPPMWWKTARQPFVTQPTAESELVASSEGLLLAELSQSFHRGLFPARLGRC